MMDVERVTDRYHLPNKLEGGSKEKSLCAEEFVGANGMYPFRARREKGNFIKDSPRKKQAGAVRK